MEGQHWEVRRFNEEDGWWFIKQVSNTGTTIQISQFRCEGAGVVRYVNSISMCDIISDFSLPEDGYLYTVILRKQQWFLNLFVSLHPWCFDVLLTYRHRFLHLHCFSLMQLPKWPRVSTGMHKDMREKTRFGVHLKCRQYTDTVYDFYMYCCEEKREEETKKGDRTGKSDIDDPEVIFCVYENCRTPSEVEVSCKNRSDAVGGANCSFCIFQSSGCPPLVPLIGIIGVLIIPSDLNTIAFGKAASFDARA